MELPDRIAAIIKVNQLSPAGFADLLGVQRSSVSHVLSGRNKPSLDFVQKILEHFPRVDPVWLITGKQGSQNESSEGLPVTAEVKAPIPDEGKVAKKQALPAPGDANKTIEKIVVFYTDRTFDVYEQ